MGDTDIILQGGLWSNTLETAHHYAALDFVETVIISTWTDEVDNIPSADSHPKIKWVLSPKPSNPGSCNINLQIISSYAGVQQADSPIVVKMRTDQHIFDDSMEMMNRFFRKFGPSPELEYIDGPGPTAPIFVIGMASRYPYHPQDHVFWGHKEDVLDLFDIELMDGPPGEPPDFTNNLQVPIYLGANYYKSFDSGVCVHLEDPKTYLMIGAPKHNEAMELYNTMRDKVFKVFPRIDMYWIKYDSGYWYDMYSSHGEYYHDAEWETM